MTARATLDAESAPQIVTRLFEIRDSLGPDDLIFTTNPLVGELLKTDPFAFLLAASVDRGMAAELAWELPAKLRNKIGHLDPARIARMNEAEVLDVLRSIEGRPRYLSAAARTIVDVASHVVERYGGDTRRIWTDRPVREIQRRLMDIYGVGRGIASMVLNLLIFLDEFHPSAEDYREIDVKPDRHVSRVFGRTGLCSLDPTEDEVIKCARRLLPSYPGKLDAPSWHVGRNWCHASSPDCSSCRLSDLCPKRGT